MGKHTKVKSLFSGNNGILMAIADGRFLVAEHPSIDITRESNVSSIHGTGLNAAVSRSDPEQSITIEFDTRRDPCLPRVEDRVSGGQFRLYNENYCLHLKNCIFSYTVVQDEGRGFVSNVKVETMGKINISER